MIPVDYQGEPFPTYLEWKELKQDVRLYGSRFFLCLPLGLVVAVADQASLDLGVRGRIAVLLVAAPFLHPHD